MPTKTLIITERAQRGELFRLRPKNKKVLKVVVDIESCLLAAGGDSFGEGEDALIATGSRPKDLWGALYLPKENQILCLSMINIKPDNLSLEILDPLLRSTIKIIILHLLGDDSLFAGVHNL